MSELISVITTAFNAASTIRDTVQSILNQEDVKLEYIIVDDGSTDNTLDMINEFKDERIKIIEAGRVGRGRALNIGIEKSWGEFIAILDADDLAHPRRLITQYLIMEQNSHIDVLGTDKIRIWGDQVPEWDPVHAHGISQPNLVDVSERLVYNSPIMHSSAFMKKKSLLKVKGYDTNIDAHFEWDLFIRIRAAGGLFFNVSIPLVAKRLHRNQYFENKKRLRFIISNLKLQGKAFRVLKRNLLIYFYLSLPFIFLYHLLPLRSRIVVRDFYFDNKFLFKKSKKTSSMAC